MSLHITLTCKNILGPFTNITVVLAGTHSIPGSPINHFGQVCVCPMLYFILLLIQQL